MGVVWDIAGKEMDGMGSGGAVDKAGVWRWDLCVMSDESQLVRFSGRAECFVRRALTSIGVVVCLCGMHGVVTVSRLAWVGVYGFSY